MGDPHKNVWGGKNNSWGHKPKKSSNQNRNNGPRYEPSPLFNKLAGGCVLFMLGYAGLASIGDIATSLFDVKDKVETVQEMVSSKPNKSNTTNSSSGGSSAGSQSLLDTIIENKIKDFEIGAEDVRDILNYIYENMKASDVTSTVETTVFIEYDEADTTKKYTKSVLDKLSKYDETVTFCIVKDFYKDDNEAIELKDHILDIVRETKDEAFNGGVEHIDVSVVGDLPHAGNLVIAVTFVK